MKIAIERKEVVTKEIEVLSCPFCGSDNIDVIHYAGFYGYSADEFYVKCKDCGACGGKVVDDRCSLSTTKQKELAVEKWNMRCDDK